MNGLAPTLRNFRLARHPGAIRNRYLSETANLLAPYTVVPGMPGMPTCALIDAFQQFHVICHLAFGILVAWSTFQ
jgi:hypothetical protein